MNKKKVRSRFIGWIIMLAAATAATAARIVKLSYEYWNPRNRNEQK